MVCPSFKTYIPSLVPCISELIRALLVVLLLQVENFWFLGSLPLQGIHFTKFPLPGDLPCPLLSQVSHGTYRIKDYSNSPGPTYITVFTFGDFPLAIVRF